MNAMKIVKRISNSMEKNEFGIHLFLKCEVHIICGSFSERSSPGGLSPIPLDRSPIV
jgi:hypothetical protein